MSFNVENLCIMMMTKYLTLLVSLVCILPSLILANKEVSLDESTCLYFKEQFSPFCEKGRRFYTICELTSFAKNQAMILSECIEGCNEAYLKLPVQKACEGGCNLSHNESMEMKNQFGVMNQDFSRNSLNDFLSFADSVMNQFMQQTYSSVSSFGSMLQPRGQTEIIDITDGQQHDIFIIQLNNPEINTHHPGNDKLIINTESENPKSTSNEHSLKETNLQTNANSPHSWLLYDDEIAVNKRGYDGEISKPRQLKNSPAEKYWRSLQSGTQQWWNCFTKKSGLPEMVFALFWLSLFALLLMCCCVSFNKSPKLSINGDLAFIRDSQGELPSYMSTYPMPEGAKVSPYFAASVVDYGDKKPLLF